MTIDQSSGLLKLLTLKPKSSRTPGSNVIFEERVREDFEKEWG